MKVTLLDNWSKEVFPVRLLDNITFFARVLAIKLTLHYSLGFFAGFNLLNIAIFYVNMFKLRRMKYHKLLVYFKIKWILEFIVVFMVSLSLFSESFRYGNLLIYTVAGYMLFNILTPAVLIVMDMINYIKRSKSKSKVTDLDLDGEVIDGENNT